MAGFTTITFEVYYRCRDGSTASRLVDVPEGPHAKELAAYEVEKMGVRVTSIERFRLTQSMLDEMRQEAAARRQQMKEVQ